MNYSETEVRKLLYCCGQELRARAAGKPPGPQPWLVNLIRRLELDVALSSSRQSDDHDPSDLDHDDWVGSQQVCDILGWNIWTVQRRASDLEGRKVAGKLVFRERAVLQYAEGLTDARRAN